MSKKELNKDSLVLFKFNNHVKPKIIENKTKDMVFNGKNNSYFYYVNDRYIGSPTNSAINNGYSRLIYGQGLDANNKHKNPLDWARLQTILKPSDLKSIIKDFQIQGMAYMQVILSKANTLNSIKHISAEKIVPTCADEDNYIKGYWYSNDWKNQNSPENTPIYIPAFGNNEPIELYCIKPYQIGMEYFALPSYQSGLQYAELEEEISNFLISHMKNGMSSGYVVNIPNSNNFTDEQKDKIKSQIKNKLTGSNNAGDFILNFSSGEEEIKVEVLEISDAHDKWQFSSTEAQNKLLVSHEVVSPLLFGIKDANGFSSNADELDVAEAQTMKRIIKPKQQDITSALSEVLRYYDINLNLYFKPLTEVSEADVDSSFTGIQISSAIDIITKVKTNELTIEQASSLLRSMLSYPQEEIDSLFKKTQLSKQNKQADTEVAEALIRLGEVYNSDDWEVLSEQEVDYNTDEHAHDLIKVSLTSTGTARPNSKSEQDSEDIVIRYKYVGNPNPQREFCKKMMDANKVYRKEDIIQMDNMVVNSGWGLNGSDKYSIWLYKGGGNCKHKWNRVIYLKRNGSVDVNSPLAKTITTSEARRRGYSVPVNDNLVSITPNKMPNNGFVNK